MRDDTPMQLRTFAPTLLRAVPRRPLVRRPTPARRLRGLERHAGIDGLWLKDDSGSPPVGGNKARKLEFLVGAALERGCRSLVTVGYLGTNHGLATAQAARHAGLDCEVIVLREALSDHVRDTLLRLHALGARLHHARGPVDAVAVAARALARAQWRGAAPYWIAPGGSSWRGVLGYVEAGLELAAQVREGVLPEPRWLYVPLGSAGTAAGLALGLALAGLTTQVRAVRVVDPRMASAARTVRLARDSWRAVARRDPAAAPLPPLALEAVAGFEGPGYGTDTPEALAAMTRARDHEELALEVTYTGRTLAALLAEAAGGLRGPTVLWNTFHPRGDPPDGVSAADLPRSLAYAFSAT